MIIAEKYGRDCALDALLEVNASSNKGNTELHEAALLCDKNLMWDLLESGADIKAENKKGDTALNIVLSNCEEDVFLEFVNYGKRLGGLSNNGETQLIEGAEYSPFQVIVAGLVVVGAICCMVRPIRRAAVAAVKYFAADKKPQVKTGKSNSQPESLDEYLAQQIRTKEKKSPEVPRKSVSTQLDIVTKESKIVSLDSMNLINEQLVGIQGVSQQGRTKEKKSPEVPRKSVLVQKEATKVVPILTKAKAQDIEVSPKKINTKKCLSTQDSFNFLSKLTVAKWGILGFLLVALVVLLLSIHQIFTTAT